MQPIQDDLVGAILDQAQILTYMKLSGISVGLLINFNVKRLKHGIKRYGIVIFRDLRALRGEYRYFIISSCPLCPSWLNKSIL